MHIRSRIDSLKFKSYVDVPIPFSIRNIRFSNLKNLETNFYNKKNDVRSFICLLQANSIQNLRSM